MSLKGYEIKDIHKVIRCGEGKMLVNIDIKRLTAPGENYLSLVFGVNLEVEDADGKTETIHSVAKRLPLKSGKGIDFNFMAMRNEIRWYSEIVPLLTDFATEYGIGAEYYVKHLGSRLSLDPSKVDADSESVLIIENLIPQGYKNEDRLTGFDLQTAKAILTALAKFHAIPLVIKFKKPELFKVIKNFLHFCTPSFVPEEEGGKTPALPEELVLEKALEILECQKFVQNIKNLKDRFIPMNERFVAVGEEPWNTIVHNDLWGNNIMFKPRKAEERTLVKILDFQMCLYTSYARDVAFFLLTSLKDDLQLEHFDDFIRYYYDEFTTILNKFDIPELRLSYQDYLDHLKEATFKYEAMHALFHCNVIFAAKGGHPDLLTGEVDMFEHLYSMVNNMGKRSKEKIALVVKLCVDRGWM